MNEDRLLRDLAQLVSEHDEGLARFEATCAQAAGGLATTAENEMLHPLSGSFRAAMVARLAQELASDAAAGEPQRSFRNAKASSVVSSIAAMLAQLLAPVRALAQWPAAGLGAAAAAVVLTALGLGLFREGLLGTDSFPAYDLRLQGKAYLRGAESTGEGPVAFTAGDSFRLLLRPETALAGPVEARAFVLVGDVLQPLTVPPAQVLDNGVVMMQGEVGTDVLLPSGDARLLVVVARPDALPEEAELLRQLRGQDRVRTRTWNAWSLEIELKP